MAKNTMKFRFLDTFVLDFDESRFLFDTYYDFDNYSDSLLDSISFYAWLKDNKPNFSEKSLINSELVIKEMKSVLNEMTNEDDFENCIEYFESVITEIQKWAKSVIIKYTNNIIYSNKHTICRFLEQLAIECDYLLDFLYFESIS